MTQYQVGDKIKICDMDGEPHYTGKEGVITSIDDMGQLHGTWGGLAVNPHFDVVRILEKKKPSLKQLIEREIKNGNMSAEIMYDDFTIYHDIIDDTYYIELFDEDIIKQVTLVTELRYEDGIDIYDGGFIRGYGEALNGYDYSGEFLGVIEEGNTYYHRYGYFREVSKEQPNVLTQLVVINKEGRVI